MEYIHWRVDATSAGTAIIQLRGVECDVIILDRTNFDRFRRRSSYNYVGGHFKRSPARLPITGKGEWYVVVIPGPGGKVEASLTLA